MNPVICGSYIFNSTVSGASNISLLSKILCGFMSPSKWHLTHKWYNQTQLGNSELLDVSSWSTNHHLTILMWNYSVFINVVQNDFGNNILYCTCIYLLFIMTVYIFKIWLAWYTIFFILVALVFWQWMYRCFPSCSGYVPLCSWICHTPSLQWTPFYWIMQFSWPGTQVSKWPHHLCINQEYSLMDTK